MRPLITRLLISFALLTSVALAGASFYSITPSAPLALAQTQPITDRPVSVFLNEGQSLIVTCISKGIINSNALPPSALVVSCSAAPIGDPSSTPAPINTDTPQPVPTIVSTDTPTILPLPSDTPVLLPSATDTLLPTDTPPPTPSDTATNTSIPPTGTDTPMPTATWTPVPTDTPSPTNTPVIVALITPYAGAPDCPEPHNTAVWHAHWDAARGCYYNGEHGDNPALLDHLFGPLGTAWNGSAFDYPHHSSPAENIYEQFIGDLTKLYGKHKGFKVWVNTEMDKINVSIPCQQRFWEYLNNSAGCIRNMRITFHNLGGPADMAVALHSVWAEVEVCDRTFTDCGIVQTGGLLNFSNLQIPYKKLIIPQDTDIAPCNRLTVHDEPYRSARTITDTQSVFNGGYAQMRTPFAGENTNNISVWSSEIGFWEPCAGYGEIFQANWRNYDELAGYNQVDISAEVSSTYKIMCPNGDCAWNNTLRQVYQAMIYLDPLDFVGHVDATGHINYDGYTDPFGNVRTDCTAPSAICIRLIIKHVKPLLNQWGQPQPFIWSCITNLGYDNCTRRNGQTLSGPTEYDQSVAPEWRIKYPN